MANPWLGQHLGHSSASWATPVERSNCATSSEQFGENKNTTNAEEHNPKWQPCGAFAATWIREESHESNGWRQEAGLLWSRWQSRKREITIGGPRNGAFSAAWEVLAQGKVIAGYFRGRQPVRRIRGSCPNLCMHISLIPRRGGKRNG